MMIAQFDPQRTGKMGFNEFQALWKFVMEWEVVFQAFDRDRSRSIDPNELHAALQRFGYTLTPAFINLLIFKYDRSGSRTISFDDFIQIGLLLQNLTGEFRRYDRQQVSIPLPSSLPPFQSQ